MKAISLKEISEKMRSTSPVFIGGAGRSGTTLLYLTIQKHSSFRPEIIDLTESHIFAYGNASYQLGKEYAGWKNLYNYMLKNSKNYEQFLAYIKRIQAFHRVTNIKNLFRRVSNRIIWAWLIGLNFYVVRSFFYWAQKSRKCKRILEKTPGNERHVSQIICSFPKSKILFIYRHPIDVYSSYKRRLNVEMKMGKKLHQLRWLRISQKDFCLQYKRSVEAILKAPESRLSSIYVVRYESLTENPEKELFNICKFLNESYDETSFMEQAASIPDWRPDPHLFRPITKNIKYWQDNITFEQAKYIEIDLRKIMIKLQYKSYTNSF